MGTFAFAREESAMSNANTAKTLTNILFATDFSPESEALLPYVCTLVRAHDALLIIAHVVPPITSVEAVVTTSLFDIAHDYMDRLMASEHLAGLSVQQVVAEGNIWETLNDVIRAHNVDLVIAGTHGRKGVGKFLLGSVAESIFRHAPCPVMTIGPHVFTAELSARVGSVLCATDLEWDPAAAIAHASRFVVGGGRFILLTVADPALAQNPEAEKELHSRLARLAPVGMQIQVLVRFGNVAEEILNTAHGNNAQLIVLGAHLPHAFHERLHHVAYKVACESPVPVLTCNTRA